MRISILFVLLLCIVTAKCTWWLCTRNLDFLTPPSSIEINHARQHVVSTFPQINSYSNIAKPVIKIPELNPNPPPIQALPVLEIPQPQLQLDVELQKILQNSELTPSLNEYCELASKGNDFFEKIATELEGNGKIARALLAWERVLDCGNPTTLNISHATSAIKRLRDKLPAWNNNEDKALNINMHFAINYINKKKLTPIIKRICKKLSQLSSNIVKVVPDIATTDRSEKRQLPIAIWLTGNAPNSFETKVLTFTLSPETDIPGSFYSIFYQLICSEMPSNQSILAPPDIDDSVNPLEAINFYISRRCWYEFANFLNQPIIKN